MVAMPHGLASPVHYRFMIWAPVFLIECLIKGNLSGRSLLFVNECLTQRQIRERLFVALTNSISKYEIETFPTFAFIDFGRVCLAIDTIM